MNNDEFEVNIAGYDDQDSKLYVSRSDTWQCGNIKDGIFVRFGHKENDKNSSRFAISLGELKLAIEFAEKML